MNRFLIAIPAALLISAQVLAEPPAHQNPFHEAKPLPEAALKQVVGKENVSQIVNARNTSNVSDNTVGDNSSTGAVSFDGQAFQGLRGLSVLSANTGNNVSINASMNVNVAIRQ